MKFATAIIIFFVAIIALVAEFFLYMIFGVSLSFSGGASTLTGLATFFVILMVLTIATGVLAPICAVIEMIVTKSADLSKIKHKKENKFRDWFLKDVGTSLLLIFLTLILILLIFTYSMKSISEENTKEPVYKVTKEIEQETKKVEEQTEGEVKKIEKELEEVKEPEPAKPQLEIISHNDKNTFGILSIVGEVKNNGNIKAEYVKVTAKFYKDDKFVDREYTYVDNQDIPAGEIDTFEIMSMIKDYDKYELLVSS